MKTDKYGKFETGQEVTVRVPLTGIIREIECDDSLREWQGHDSGLCILTVEFGDGTVVEVEGDIQGTLSYMGRV